MNLSQPLMIKHALCVAVWCVVVCSVLFASTSGLGEEPANKTNELTSMDLSIDLKGDHAQLIFQSLTSKKSPVVAGSHRLKSLSDNDFFTMSHLLVVAINKAGEEIYQTIVKDSGLLRAEVFHEHSGAIEESRRIYRDVQLNITLPYTREIDRLHIFRWHSAYEKVLIGDILINVDNSPTVETNVEVNKNNISRQQASYNYETMVNTGPASNRVDIVILGDGYQVSELDKYAQDVEAVIDGYFAIDPYREYESYFNIHRIDVVSNESGVDHPSEGIYRDTALDSYYDCANIQRLICSDTSIASTITSSTLSSDAMDIILVVVNDDTYGGSGGSIAVISTHWSAVDLALHEIGHSFGWLADEYGGTNDPSCNSSSEPWEENVTINTDRNTIKWAHWIDAATAVPTSTSVGDGIPGLFEGGAYCDYGVYRPTNDSMMRTLARPFEQINEELLVKRIYDYVSLLDDYSPVQSALDISQSDLQLFSVTTLTNVSDTISVDWQVDGESMFQGSYFWLVAKELSVGSHTITAVVSDDTGKVIVDTYNNLRDSQSWIINVASSQSNGVPVYDAATASAILPLIDMGEGGLHSGVLLLTDATQFIFEMKNLQASSVSDASSDEIAIYTGDSLWIPRINVAAVDYAVELVLIQASPLQFKLRSIQAAL